ncbi:hypothetical protein N9064_00620 [bacterium]|nr:hypothetical protein [bacterium]
MGEMNEVNYEASIKKATQQHYQDHLRSLAVPVRNSYVLISPITGKVIEIEDNRV